MLVDLATGEVTGRQLVEAIYPSQPDAAESTNTDLWVVPVEGPISEDSARNLTATNGGWDGDPVYSPDGRHIAYVSQETPGYESDLRRLALLERDSGRVRYLTSRDGFDDWVGELAWDGNEHILFSADRKGRNPIFRLALAGGDDWVYRLGAEDAGEIADAVDGVERRFIDIVDMTRDDFPLPRVGDLLRCVRRELLDGRGLAVLRGLPVVDWGRRRAAIAYFGIGRHVGTPISQNAQGHVLGHVKDYGRRYDDPTARGYQTSAEMGFHADHADYVGLLCLQVAKSGGASLLASSVTLYNRMLAARPDLAAVLTGDFYWTRHGEIPPGAEPWYRQPVFAFERGYFSARGASSYIRKAQGLPGVPPLTDAQLEAMALFQSMARDCAATIDFEPGDIQLLHNHVIVHTRTAFEDWSAPERRRHLLRLWLKDDDGRPVAPLVRDSFQGIHVAGFRPVLPLDDADGQAA